MGVGFSDCFEEVGVRVGCGEWVDVWVGGGELPDGGGWGGDVFGDVFDELCWCVGGVCVFCGWWGGVWG